ncbi:hypothetical [Prochlorococcus marinus str. MIT 9313]|uniref:Uncharacterized protein n=1 Tax=Prochlorococcus marinus (strain MIT 9313) TaxID=74547 RepID=Q7V5Q6_PROMM|nr:hypothetical [Prochlorococcus marinus str. MIT 9313]
MSLSLQRVLRLNSIHPSLWLTSGCCIDEMGLIQRQTSLCCSPSVARGPQLTQRTMPTSMSVNSTRIPPQRRTTPTVAHD